MLKLYRDNDKVVFRVNTTLARDCDGKEKASIPFSWSCGQPYLADALTQYLRALLEAVIQEARRESYESGWRDAKSHRTKEIRFSDWL